MKIKRRTLTDAPIELIDRLAGNHFFSSTSFARIWRTIGGNPVYWLAEESGEVVAVLPGVEFGRGRLRRFQSMPNGCYGRILYNTTKFANHSEISESIVNRILDEKYIKVFLMDFHKTIKCSGKFNIERYTVCLVDISAPDWEPPDSKLRQQIRKGEKTKLTMETFNSSLHMNNFMHLVSLHARRRQTRVTYSQEFFEGLAAVAAQDSRVTWVWCEHEGRPVASHIFFIEGDSLMHWQMYYDEALSNLQATKFIPYSISKQSVRNGIKYLNLGLSPAGAGGAEFYKSRWGGRPYDYNCYVHKNLLGRLL